MLRPLLIGFVSVPFLALIACGGDSNRIRGAAYCVKDYAETKLKIDISNQAKKTKLEVDTKLQISEGQYKFDNAEIYVQDPIREITMHVTIEPSSDGNSASIKLNCIGGTFGGEDPNKGVSPKMNPFVISLPVANTFEIDTNKNSKFSSGTITIDYRPRPGESALQALYAIDDKSNDGQLNDIYEGFDETSQYLYEFSNQNLELRSSFKLSKGSGAAADPAVSLNKQSIIGLIRFDKIKPE